MSGERCMQSAEHLPFLVHQALHVLKSHLELA